MTIENRLSALKASADKARQAQTRAEIERDNALVTRDKALAELKAEFNASTLDEGLLLLKNLKEELETKISDLESEVAEMS